VIKLFILLLSINIYADSCRPLVPYLKEYSHKYISDDFPYWYLIGQGYQESRCRNVISMDGVGSQGYAQITWRVWRHFLQARGINNLNSRSNITRAHVLIMKRLIAKASNKGYNKLWVAFQAYNGGWLVLKEISRTPKHLRYMQYEVSKRCRRKIIHFSNGQSISACKINYSYPIQIETFCAKFYSDLMENTTWVMW